MSQKARSVLEQACPTLSTRFDEALAYASQLHRTQLRKGTSVPYIAHLLGVTAIVLEYGGTEDEAIAALLHDAVEDQGGQSTLEEIRRMFGEHAATIVADCSDTDTIPKPPWEQRKADYIAHLADVSASALLVSAADKLHNARSILADFRQSDEDVWSRFNGGRIGTLWYYRALADAFQHHAPGPLSGELERTVDELEREAGVKAQDS